MTMLRAGDWVRVRSKEEILRTLDKNGRLEKMPFMPEMFACCGKRMRVYKRAHKSCDTINPISKRTLENTVLLTGIRCNGAAHGGCQAQCSLFWREEWLAPLDDKDTDASIPGKQQAGTGCTEADVVAATQTLGTSPGSIKYRCQATDLPLFSAPINSRRLELYIEDYTSGNYTLRQMLGGMCYALFTRIARPDPDSNADKSIKLYDWFQRLCGGVPYPRRKGVLEPGKSGPLENLNLAAGDLVRVKSYEKILEIIDKDNKDRGLFFDAEMVPYCGGIFRVRTRVERFIDERTGEMRTMKTPAVILDGVWCRSYYSHCREFCPRAIYSWWREAWLERAPEGVVPTTVPSLGARGVLGMRTGDKIEA